MAPIHATRRLGSTILAFALALPAASSLAVTDADRMGVYKDFRAQYDARQYAAAKPLAEKLVQLTEEQYGADELQVSTPLTNLATVNYKLGDFPTAIQNYQRSLRILQSKSTMADKQQIRPLHGLGVSFMGANDPESAVVALKRAADLSRNTEGLFNISQIEFIDPLIDAYAATARYAEADKEATYAMRVEEAAYGRNSVKLIGRLDKLARWYEDGRHYTTERNTYERSLSILQKAAPENDLRRVGPLRGIARSFRLEMFYGEEGADTGTSFNSGTSGAPVFTEGSQQRRGGQARGPLHRCPDGAVGGPRATIARAPAPTAGRSDRLPTTSRPTAGQSGRAAFVVGRVHPRTARRVASPRRPRRTTGAMSEEGMGRPRRSACAGR